MDHAPADKRRLRGELRAQRLAMNAATWAARCSRIEARLRSLPALRQAARVASFWPMVERREVDLRPLHDWLRNRRCEVYYPFMRHGAGGFARVDDMTELEPTRLGFMQPKLAAPRAVEGQLEVILVPALAVTPEGLRLGYGAGFYDRLLPRFRPPALAAVVVFEEEVLSVLPSEPHDQACDLVVTDAP